MQTFILLHLYKGCKHSQINKNDMALDVNTEHGHQIGNFCSKLNACQLKRYVLAWQLKFERESRLDILLGRLFQSFGVDLRAYWLSWNAMYTD